MTDPGIIAHGQAHTYSNTHSKTSEFQKKSNCVWHCLLSFTMKQAKEQYGVLVAERRHVWVNIPVLSFQNLVNLGCRSPLLLYLCDRKQLAMFKLIVYLLGHPVIWSWSPWVSCEIKILIRCHERILDNWAVLMCRTMDDQNDWYLHLSYKAKLTTCARDLFVFPCFVRVAASKHNHSGAGHELVYLFLGEIWLTLDGRLVQNRCKNWNQFQMPAK